MNLIAIIPAAGSGNRMGGSSRKQFLEVSGRSLLWWTVQNLAQSELIEGIIIAVPPDAVDDSILQFATLPKVMQVIAGGDSRGESVKNCVEKAEAEFVMVHDGARPLITPAIVERVYRAAMATGAATAAIPVVDTMKRHENGVLTSDVDRTGLLQVQTPQCFKRQLLQKAYTQLKELNFTDETSMLQQFGLPVAWVDGDIRNIKVTHPADMLFVESQLINR